RSLKAAFPYTSGTSPIEPLPNTERKSTRTSSARSFLSLGLQGLKAVSGNVQERQRQDRTRIINTFKRGACECDCEKTRARNTAKLFYGLFYGRAKFRCKSAQVSATLCECWIAEIPSVRNAVRRCGNERKRRFLNYESPALTAELQA